MEREKTLIVIGGPTAVGKTAVSIGVAKHLQTEIVSADSRQVYHEMTIGTAKPTHEELSSVRHHFINSRFIKDEYDAAQYGRDALATIESLFKTKDHVVLCGGSGLYIRAVCEGFDEIPDVDDSIRDALIIELETKGIARLQEMLGELDPGMIQHIDTRNPHRLIRALEIKIGTGESILTFRQQKKLEHDFRIKKFALELPRDILYKRIEARLEQMLLDGLVKEARALYPYRDKNALQTVGYQEIFGFIENQYDYTEMVRLLKRNTRRYAKRQITWFKRDREFQWLDASDQPIERILSVINQ